MYRGLLGYFPWALFQVAAHSMVSDRKHNPETPESEAPHWAREKSTDHADAIIRHLAEMHTDPLYHKTAAAWRALALLQEHGEALGAEPGVSSVFPSDKPAAPARCEGCGEEEDLREGYCFACTTNAEHGQPAAPDSRDAATIMPQSFSPDHPAHDSRCTATYCVEHDPKTLGTRDPRKRPLMANDATWYRLEELKARIDLIDERSSRVEQKTLKFQAACESEACAADQAGFIPSYLRNRLTHLEESRAEEAGRRLALAERIGALERGKEDRFEWEDRQARRIGALEQWRKECATAVIPWPADVLARIGALEKGFSECTVSPQRITNLEQAMGQLKSELDARPIPDSYREGFSAAVKALQAERLSKRMADMERDIWRIENRPCTPEAIERRIAALEALAKTTYAKLKLDVPDLPNTED